MELAPNLAVAAGIIVEILLLWETADRQRDAGPAPGILAPRLSRIQEITLIVLIVSWICIALAEYVNPPLSLNTLSFIQNAIMGPSFFFLFIFGMVIPKLMPRINEQTIVAINLIVLISLPAGIDWYWLAALLLPSLGVLVIALTNRIIHPGVKSLLYFWYLICLFIISYQNSYDLLASDQWSTSLEYFIGGASGIFLLLHSIFLVRFFLMLTANILPQNRYLVSLAMPQLFDDQQIPLLKFFGILAILAVIIVANQLTGLVASASLLNLLILLVVHFMDRPFALDQT